MKKTLDNYIFTVQEKGSYTFSLESLRKWMNGNSKALSLSLARAVQRKKIVSIRKSFYAILTPEFTKKGMIPVTYFLDDLMKWLNRPYYLCHYSAAAFWGAGHQQPMETYVMIEKPPLRSIKNDKLILNYLVKNHWDSKDLILKKTNMGYLPISSPELTALDLLYYQHKGGINRAISIIDELSESMDPQKLADIANRYPKTAPVQRLGYLLDRELGLTELSTTILHIIQNRKLSFSSLSILHPKIGKYDSRWKIIQNTTVDSDI
jgi:predicted transcriptional regulator of viral defense system